MMGKRESAESASIILGPRTIIRARAPYTRNARTDRQEVTTTVIPILFRPLFRMIHLYIEALTELLRIINHCPPV